MEIAPHARLSTTDVIATTIPLAPKKQINNKGAHIMMLQYLLNSLIDSLIIGFVAATIAVGGTISLIAIYGKIHGCTYYQTTRIFRANFILAHRKIHKRAWYQTSPTICKKLIDMFFRRYFHRYLTIRRSRMVKG